MDYEGVDANSFTVNLKRKKFPWVLVLCAGFFFAVVVPVILVQGQPKSDTSLTSNLAEPAPEVIAEQPVAEEVVPPVSEPIVVPVPPDPAPEIIITEPAPVVEPVVPIVEAVQPVPQRFRTCKDANDAGEGNFVGGVDPEYEYHSDPEGDNKTCEY